MATFRESALDNTHKAHKALAASAGMARHRPAAHWEQLSCPPDILAGARNICSEFCPGKTTMGLFTGTGADAALAAEVIATDLHRDLVRIDLGAVVSKLIGETEKNLQRVFDAAEQDGAVLVLDEADALFGKRSDVRDSHDRYANLEVGYLLQRIETYPGLVIIATHNKHKLDTAFLRRMRFIIDFPASE